MTLLCVPIFVRDFAQARSDMARAAEHGADIIELRVDVVETTDEVRQLLQAAPLPCIVTRRRADEGGQSTDSDHERLAFLAEVARGSSEGAKPAYIDVEMRTIESDSVSILEHDPGRSERCGLIVSSHDFKGRPLQLHALLEKMANSPADVIKLVTTARSIRDNAEVLELVAEAPKPMIGLCMGEAGNLSRVLAGKFGGYLTFASLDASSATAPGQVSIQEMLELYRFRSIKAETKVYGVVGCPVAHSMSPALHNAGFAAVRHDGVYLPLRVEEGYESFKAFMETYLELDGMHLSGLSVTIPHKENALKYLLEKGAEVDELAKSIGALNTIDIRQPSNAKSSASEPKLRGFSTDYAAILDTICAGLGISRNDLRGKRVAVLGAGGTGRTAVAALAHYGATVVVYNRTRERADLLAAEFNGKGGNNEGGVGGNAGGNEGGKVVSAAWEKICDTCCDVLINTTSLGMHPHTDASPLDGQNLKLTPEHLVFDTVYNPLETKLLKQAKAAGAKTAGGLEMFVRQAAGQFECWTGKPAPMDLMRGIVEKRLSRPA